MVLSLWALGAQPPKGDLCHEAPTHAVIRISRSSATGLMDMPPALAFAHGQLKAMYGDTP